MVRFYKRPNLDYNPLFKKIKLYLFIQFSNNTNVCVVVIIPIFVLQVQTLISGCSLLL